MEGEFGKRLSSALLLVTNLSSALMVIGSLFLVQIFSILYGVAGGAVLQSNADGSQVAHNLQQLVSQATYFHDGIFESYVLAVIAMIATGIAFIMFVRRFERGSGNRKYMAMHLAFVFVYILVFAIVYIDSSAYLTEAYIYALYLGIAASFISDLYLNYYYRTQPEHVSKLKRSIKVDPNTPFSNLIELQDKVFSNLSGHLRIVDKHFNSAALANFHRLVSDSIQQFDNISIITSTEMLDSGFGKNMSDFKKELEGSNVGFEVRFMDDNDKVDQHERIMLDDSVAYKIPPFNIINKRSEHIILINHGEAKKRFDYLYSRAISYENYSVKKARDTDNKQQ